MPPQDPSNPNPAAPSAGEPSFGGSVPPAPTNFDVQQPAAPAAPADPYASQPAPPASEPLNSPATPLSIPGGAPDTTGIPTFGAAAQVMQPAEPAPVPNSTFPPSSIGQTGGVVTPPVPGVVGDTLSVQPAAVGKSSKKGLIIAAVVGVLLIVILLVVVLFANSSTSNPSTNTTSDTLPTEPVDTNTTTLPQ